MQNFTAEMFRTGTLLMWDNLDPASTANGKITIQYSTEGVPHLYPNTPPYVVRDLVQPQSAANVLWHANTEHVTHWYSAWVYYEDSDRWFGPFSPDPTPTPAPDISPGLVDPFTLGSLSFSKLGTNTKLATRQDIIVDVLVWLPESQSDREGAIEAALQLVAPAHTKLNVMYERYYIAQTTTDHFNSANIDLDVYKISNGTIINKKPTIDSSYSGRADILGGV